MNNEFRNTPKEEISKDDFRFVQMDEKIHDVKFETKPTTFFKDATRRFRRNKSSVTAGIIIGILILLAVVVPVANKSDIKHSFPQGSFLPPRWPGFDKVNGLNGTRKYSNILLDVSDPDNPKPAPDSENGNTLFYVDAIRGEIKTQNAYFSTANEYGRGGVVVFRTDKRDVDGALVSPTTYFDFNNNFQTTITFDERNTQVEVPPTYAIFLDVKYTFGGDFTPIILKDFSNNPASDYGTLVIDDITEKVIANQPEGAFTKNLEARFRIVLKTTAATVNEGRYPALYMKSFETVNLSNPEDDTFVTTGITWTSGNELLLRDKRSATDPRRWPVTGNALGVRYSGAKTVMDVEVTLGTFYYDEYLEVFGARKLNISQADFIRDYINPGLVRYDFSVGIESFEIVDDSVPVSKVLRQIETNILGKRVISLDVEILMYKYYGFDQIPYYLFGTNQRGHDFFKVVFSGLSTSLILGVVVTLINVLIGLIWGAISGYYGGTVDLVMERISEILSGVPSIVVFTLTILTLGNTFGVFIMAMILTGWIGVAARTRSQFYRYKGREYVLASRTLGAKDGRIIFRHILPNSVGPLITSGVLMIPGIIFTEASISYLNLGLQGLPSFGVAMSEVQGYIHTSPFLIVAASIIVSLLMVSFNLFGNGLRDAFNPSLKGVE